MTGTLVRKLLREVRTALIVVALLLLLFQLLWAVITRRIVSELLPLLTQHIQIDFLRSILFQGPGRIVQAIMGGDNIDFAKAMDLFSVSYVHPLTQTILCIWAIGRASAAIAGEIDKGTMELLLAQPIRRSQLIFAHFLVDLIVIPLLCLVLWVGTWLGSWMLGLIDHSQEGMRVYPWRFGPSLFNMGLLVWAVSGMTMWISSAGRFRGRVLGTAIVLTLLQFLINVFGQLWPPGQSLRYFTVFYYFQPQPIILHADWYQDGMNWLRMAVLLIVGTLGYLLAWRTFCRRDIPAPL
jgi:ABC-2 type transport system permease protein